MKQRIISAFFMLLISIPLVYIGGIPFYIFAIVVGFLGYKEILNLFIDDIIIKQISIISFLTLLCSDITSNNLNNLLNYKLIGIILILFSLTMLLYHKSKKIDVPKLFSLIGITIFLAISFKLIIIIRNINLIYFIYLFIITISTDTFAQFSGMLFGRHKINEISPKKTYEGCIGGSLLGTVIATIFYITFIGYNKNIFIITFFLTIIGQIGDLFFSIIKRYYNIKDYSNLIPAHGGILDRLDSIIFVVLAFTYFMEAL